ncbi:MAG: hypothetical protein H6907_04860 [Hyphomicrobiales bacterium]|nr:hypothetical protein [Hyphomicrobiales bacterium]MCP5371045.1 hypothetical protein [Hyphomicrobiales bacterium]
MKDENRRRLLRLLLALAVPLAAAPVAACGRKAAPVAPEGSKYPRKYPAE